GGAWDNAKKHVEANLSKYTSELYESTIVGDTVGDPFKDTTSVSINPIIKFTTLFGLIALELTLQINNKISLTIRLLIITILLCSSIFFIIKSFKDMYL
ncbi:MAG: sodium/proton-translocating pyrophosphatase, partial [Endomicrobium sp.]|nr:sodium/proton-translocating pyrophosphatase [Endomicrobium sp.]